MGQKRIHDAYVMRAKMTCVDDVRQCGCQEVARILPGSINIAVTQEDPWITKDFTQDGLHTG